MTVTNSQAYYDGKKFYGSGPKEKKPVATASLFPPLPSNGPPPLFIFLTPLFLSLQGVLNVGKGSVPLTSLH